MNTLKIILILIAIIIVWTFGRTFLLVQKSKELVADSQPFTQEVKNPTERILVLGDSTAVGTGVSDPRYSIAGRLGSAHPNARIENWAVNGNKIEDVKRQIEDKDLEQYDLVLLQVGANDIIFHTPLRKAHSDAVEVLDLIQPHAEQIAWIVSGNIGLAPFFPQPTGWYFEYRTKQFHAAFRKIARNKHVSFIELYENKENDPFAKNPHTYYAADLLHLSDVGYEVWFAELANVVKSTLED